LGRLKKIPGILIFGDPDPDRAEERLGVIPLAIQGISHFKAAAILGYEFGIGVRSGCFCAHPYILHLLRLTPEQANDVRRRILTGDRSDMPGLIRASFGLYNTIEEVDRLVEALTCIAQGKHQGEYEQERSSGEFKALGWTPNFERYFSLLP
jgi:selenocysteine lyase/cysteine desulfurase